jgi:hypothetical protein
MLWGLSVTEQRYRAVLEVLDGTLVTEVGHGRWFTGLSQSANRIGGQAMPRRLTTRTPPPGSTSSDRGQERLDVGLRGPDGSRKRPAHPGQVGIGKAGIRQVSASEIVHGAVQESSAPRDALRKLGELLG